VEAIATFPPNIYTKAYETIRKSWAESGLWDKRWGVLPGMAWKHEELFEDVYGSTRWDNSVETRVHEAGNERNGLHVPISFPAKSLSMIMSVEEPPALNAEQSPSSTINNARAQNTRRSERIAKLQLIRTQYSRGASQNKRRSNDNYWIVKA
jgi:hypothetical protein